MRKHQLASVVLGVALVGLPGCSKESTLGSNAGLVKEHPALESLLSKEPDLEFGKVFWAEEARKANDYAKANSPVADWNDTVWDEGVRICAEPAVRSLPNCVHFQSAIQMAGMLTSQSRNLRDPEFIPAYRLSTGTEPSAELLAEIERLKKAPPPAANDEALGQAVTDVLRP